MAAQPAPAISSFTASPTVLAQTGGSVTLSATVSGATSCAISSSPAITGLPQTQACTSGTVSLAVTVPADTTKAAKTYTFTLAASGSSTVKKTTTVTVALAPTVSSFKATASSLPYEPFPDTLTATVLNATTCQVSSTPTVPGLPGSMSCTSGTASFSMTLPENDGPTPVAYTLTLTATGATTATATATITLTVSDLASIALSPDGDPDAITIAANGNQQFVVVAYDGAMASIGDYTGAVALTMTPDDPTTPLCDPVTGTCTSCSNSTLTCTSTVAGDYTVTAYIVTAAGAGLTSDGVDLTVIPGPVASLTIDPTTDQVEPGVDEDFDVDGFDQYMNPIDPPLAFPDVSLSINAAAGTNPSDGTCNALECYAFDAGAYTVVASDGDISSPPSTLTVIPGDPVSLTVTPGTTTIIAGPNTNPYSLQTYAISGVDKYGNQIPSITDGVELDTSDPGAYPYTADGDPCNDADGSQYWCSSDNVGAWTVTATVVTDDEDGTSTTATGTTTMTVDPYSIQLTQLTSDDEPPPPEVVAGDPAQFNVEAFDSNGNDIGPIDNGATLWINTVNGSCNPVTLACTVEAIGTFTVTAAYGATPCTPTTCTANLVVIPDSLQLSPETPRSVPVAPRLTVSTR